MEDAGFEPDTFEQQAVTLRTNVSLWSSTEYDEKAKFILGGRAGLMSDDTAGQNHA
jgi:hypothetical protein